VLRTAIGVPPVILTAIQSAMVPLSVNIVAKL
jgi:hypothetical protein